MVDKDLIQREFEHCFGGNKFVTISDDGLISTDSWAVFRSGTKLELPVKFDKVRGDFGIENAVRLRTLDGCPRWVGESFRCDNAPSLLNLRGCPIEVGGGFSIQRTGITNLEGMPRVAGIIICKDNQLTSLAGAPTTSKSFNCAGNLLKSLEGCPQVVDGFFKCDSNLLTTLIGGPRSVSSFYSCSFNTNLTSLEGLAETIEGSFTVNWRSNLKVLPILRSKIGLRATFVGAPAIFQSIMNRYINCDVKAVLTCASELIANGYEGNV